MEAISLPRLNGKYRLPEKIHQLDSIRGLAVAAVLIFHLEAVIPSPFSRVAHQLWIGVDLFFVLSGFLITGILWDTKQQPRYFRNFYIRRILRIWPVYSMLICLAFCLMPLTRAFSPVAFQSFLVDPVPVWAYLLMIQNWFPTLLRASPFLLVTWSLAIEEQFYLVWPAVVRSIHRGLIIPCLMATLCILAVNRIVAMRLGLPQIAIYYSPLTHGDGLISGSIIALWIRLHPPSRMAILTSGIILIFVGVGSFLSVVPYKVTSQYCSPLVFTYVSMLSSGLLLVALVSENVGQFIHRHFFMSKPLSFLGFVSYGLYMYHFPIIRMAVSEKLLTKADLWHNPALTRIAIVTIGVGMSIFIAWISRVTIEKAALARRRRFA